MERTHTEYYIIDFTKKIGAFGGQAARPRQFSDLSDYSQLFIAGGETIFRTDPRVVFFPFSCLCFEPAPSAHTTK